MEAKGSGAAENSRGHSKSRHMYDVVYQQSGVFIHIPWATEAETVNVEPAMVIYDLQRRGINGISIGEMIVRIRTRQSPIKAGEAQKERPVKPAAFVQVGRDGMTATMQLLPGSENGGEADAQDIIKQIKEEWHVTFGLDIAAIEDAVKNEKYYEPIEIAKGQPAEKGKDGYLTFLFETEHSYAPRLLEDGSADYKDLNLFSNVTEGDTVVVRIPPEPGVPGMKVTGEVIPPQSGAEAKMPRGKNVLVSEDGSRLIAQKSGRIDYVQGQVQVSDIYMVPGDVDMSVGNLDFDGNVQIRGGIIGGLTVRAAGSIEVGECVEASTLIAGKDIILQKGVQGMDKADLQAGGNVVSKFIERSRVEAGGSVYSDYIVHSNIIAGDSIILKGKRGRAIGGILRAGRELRVKTLGTPSGEKTVVEVGAAPQLRAQIVELNAKAAQLKAQLDKIDNLTRMPRKNETADRQEIWEKLLFGREALLESYACTMAEIEEKKQKIEEISGGAVHVYGVVYHDVRISIDSATCIVRESLEFATFRYRGGEVKFSVCEISER